MNKVLNVVIDVLQNINTINHGILHAWTIIIGAAIFIIATKLCGIFGFNLGFVFVGTVAILMAFYSAYEIRNFKGFPLR